MKTPRLSGFNRFLRFFGLRYVAATPDVTGSSSLRSSNYRGADAGRLTGDWVPRLLSADYEARGALQRLRARCRELARNDVYAGKVVGLIVKNVIGADGLQLEPKLKDDASANLAMAVDDNAELKRAWRDFCSLGQCTVDGQSTGADLQRLAMRIWAVDGECFLRKVGGFPHSRHRFALQFIDADRVDASFNRFPNTRAGNQNEVRMGVEVDAWRRPVAYWITKGHPTEGGGGFDHDRVPASEMIHLYIPERADQTRGIPLLHAAMTRLHMLGSYEEAELVACRIAACMMGFAVSKTGDDYAGGAKNTDGAKEISLTPGTFEQLPEGWQMQTFNPQHPNANYPEFLKRMLQGAAAGADVSYAGLTGDLRDVNFSSIRQGVIEERDVWRLLQTFARDHLCQPVFEAWFDYALLSRQLSLPVPSDAERQAIFASMSWQARGWTWVDPLKDVAAAIDSIGAGLTSLRRECANRGYDWREIIDELAEEDAYAKAKGVDLRTKGVASTPVGATNEPDPGQEGDSAPPEPSGPAKNRRGAQA